MKSKYSMNISGSKLEINVFADKSALILEWLLTVGIERKKFSLREVVREVGLSIGQAQKVFNYLVLQGFLKTEGVETSKRFILSKPKSLLISWTKAYDIVKKSKTWNYRSACSSREELLNILGKSKLSQKVVRALHSSADFYKCKNTNLETLELCFLDEDIKHQIEELLELEPQSRGYDVLLIQPYYKHMVQSCMNSKKSKKNIACTSPLLTYLDLYNFPLRGREQAEYMAGKIEELNRIFEAGK